MAVWIRARTLSNSSREANLKPVVFKFILLLEGMTFINLCINWKTASQCWIYNILFVFLCFGIYFQSYVLWKCCDNWSQFEFVTLLAELACYCTCFCRNSQDLFQSSSQRSPVSSLSPSCLISVLPFPKGLARSGRKKLISWHSFFLSVSIFLLLLIFFPSWLRGGILFLLENSTPFTKRKIASSVSQVFQDWQRSTIYPR